jgi:hypothetical protein
VRPHDSSTTALRPKKYRKYLRNGHSRALRLRPYVAWPRLVDLVTTAGSGRVMLLLFEARPRSGRQARGSAARGVLYSLASLCR